MLHSRITRAAALLAVPALLAAAPSAASAHGPRAHHGRHHRHPVAAPPAAPAKTLTFDARVLSSSPKGLTVQTASGKVLTFGPGQLAPASTPARSALMMRKNLDISVSGGNVVLNILGLQPGVEIQITMTIGPNGTTISITLPSSVPAQTVSGVVGEVDGDAFTVATGDGSTFRLHMAQDALSALNLSPCDIVDVAYHQDAGMLIADKVTPNGTSTSGDCTPTDDQTGTITKIADDAVTISTDSGPVSYVVDPSSGLTDGYNVGDLVDITYTTASDGTMTATDIQFVEEDATGTVTSITNSKLAPSLSIKDDDSGATDVFGADPTNGVQVSGPTFSGVSLGDHVDVTYHESSGHWIADAVSIG